MFLKIPTTITDVYVEVFDLFVGDDELSNNCIMKISNNLGCVVPFKVV